MFSGVVYTGTQDEMMLSFDPKTHQIIKTWPCLTPSGTKCRILGIRSFDNKIYGVSKHDGIFIFNPNTARFEWILFAKYGFLNDMVIVDNRYIYFTDSIYDFRAGDSILQRFGQFENKGSLYKFDMVNKSLETALGNLSVPNGVELDHAGTHILVSEACKFRVLKYSLKTRTASVFIENTFGAVDNIRKSKDNTSYWLGLSVFRPSNSTLYDYIATYPKLRYILTRYKWSRALLYPITAQLNHGGGFYRINKDGGVLSLYVDTNSSGAYSEVLEFDSSLIVGSPFRPYTSVILNNS